MMIKKNVLKMALMILVLMLLVLAGGCKKKVVAPPPTPPPPPPPPPAPTVTISANPTTIEKGLSSMLAWSATNATSVSIDQGIGDVTVNGSRSVSPSNSTTYTITAKGEGGSATATTRVTVTVPAPPPPPPPPPPAGPTVEELFSQTVKDVFFDYDKSDIREDAKPLLADTAEFLKKYSSVKFNIEGNCDERGSEEYNIGLGDRRANAAKTYLVNLGVAADRINTVSYGKEKPVCTEHNDACWQQNRRDHFVLTSK